MSANDVIIYVDFFCDLLESLDRLNRLMHRGIMCRSLHVNVTSHSDEIKDVGYQLLVLGVKSQAETQKCKTCFAMS